MVLLACGRGVVFTGPMIDTEVWFRNARYYVTQLAEMNCTNLVFDWGYVVKRRIDVHDLMELHFPGKPWRALIIGDQGAMELGPQNDRTNPKAVYPVYRYGEPIDVLYDLVEQNVADVEKFQKMSEKLPVEQRLVPGQEHRVIFNHLPNAHELSNEPFYNLLAELQEAHPEIIFHIHGSYSQRVNFGLGFRSVDIDARTGAAKGWIQLPVGKKAYEKDWLDNRGWINTLGFSVKNLVAPEERCRFNIASALWAAKYYGDARKIRQTRSLKIVDIRSTDEDFEPEEVSRALSNRKRQPGQAPEGGDMFLCDFCSFQRSCKFYREEQVCGVPRSEGSEIAKAFKTRDSGRIIDGMRQLLERNAERLDRELDKEDDKEETNPEVTKLMSTVFGQAEKLAKLIDPTLTKPAVQINGNIVGHGANQIGAASNVKELTATVIRQIEAEGVPREEITDEMVFAVLSAMGNEDNAPRVISGQTIASTTTPR